MGKQVFGLIFLYIREKTNVHIYVPINGEISKQIIFAVMQNIYAKRTYDGICRP